jgi:hypothetical protein
MRGPSTYSCAYVHKSVLQTSPATKRFDVHMHVYMQYECILCIHPRAESFEGRDANDSANRADVAATIQGKLSLHHPVSCKSICTYTNVQCCTLDSRQAFIARSCTLKIRTKHLFTYKCTILHPRFKSMFHWMI